MPSDELTPPEPETRFWELDAGVTLTLQVMPDGTAFFAVPPSVQAQLDRIEAMLAQVVPKKEVEAPDFTYLHNYLRDAEPECGLFALVDVGDGTFKVKTRGPVSDDTQAWLRGQFTQSLVFEVAP